MRGELRRGRGARRTAAAAACAALALVQCGEHDGRHVALGTSPLRVEAHLPEGNTPSRFSVDVIFDRPMARLGDPAPTSERGRALLEIAPQPSGSYAWIGTRTLSFTATGGLPPATAFRARVPAGIAALDGSRLPQDVAWEFATARPALVASSPVAGSTNARPGDPLVLLFNIPVDPDAVAHAAKLAGLNTNWRASRADSLLLRQLDPQFWDADPAQIVTLAPSPPLAFDTAYTLHLDVSLRARTGSLGPAAGIALAFRTYGPPGFEAVTAPGGGVIRLAFRTPVDPDTARVAVRLDPTPKNLNAWSDGAFVYFAGDFGFERRYRVTAPAGLPDLFGQRLAESRTLEVTTPKRGPALQLLPDDAVMLPGTPRTVALVHAGMGPVRVRARRLSWREEILRRNQPISTQGPWGLDRRLKGEPDAGKLVSLTLDLRSLLPPSGLGAVLVEATAREPAGNGEGNEWQSRTILRWSDLGVSLKGGPENGLAWVTRLGTGKPIAGATVRVLDENAAELWRGRGAANGLVRMPGWRELHREPWQLSVVAASRADTASSSLQSDWRLEPWRFDIPGAYGMQPVDQRAFLYTDRDLYRPGETLRLAGLVRRFTSGGLAPAGIDSVEVLVRDPMGREFATRHVIVDRFGGFALDVAMPKDAPLGRYWIAAGLRLPAAGKPAPQRESLGSLGVELAAFRAAAFRAEVQPGATQLFPSGTLMARVKGAYYFGAPLAGAPFTWSAVRERIDFRPHGFADYAFDDPDLEGSHGGLLSSGAGVLGDSGLARVRVALPPETPVATQAIHFEANVRDPSGDTVAGRATVLYHPTHVYAGVVVEPNFVTAGEPVAARLVAVRADTALVAPGTPLVVELVRREWRAVRKLLVGGRVGFETTSVDSLVETREVTSGTEPSLLQFTAQTPGSYRVRVRSRDGASTSPAAVASFWVAGAREGAWRDEDAVRLEMQADRKVYRPGDVAHILVTTPVHASQALLTIEREGLLESRLVPMDREAQVFEIPVKPEYLPNVYVGLAVAERALSAKEAPGLPEPARLPRYAVGYVALHVDVEARRLAVEVRPERDEYGPGERASVAIEVHDASGKATPARVGLAVVDEAVLALLGTPVPDPFAFFYQERALAIGNGDTRLRLSAGSRLEAARFKGEAGGDGAEKLAARSLFTTTAYWNPDIETDAEGRARVEFALPDNLTSFRVMAIVASDVDHFGSGSHGFRVAKPLTVDPALPRFVFVGDTLEVAAVVTNRTPAPLQGRVTLVTDLRTLAAPALTLEVPAGSSRRVAIRARAEHAGDAAIRFEARFSNAADAVESRLPVAEPRIAFTAATAAHTTSAATEQVSLPPAALAGSAHLEVALAASALGGARPAFDYVVNYPYGCLEQLSSRLLVWVAGRELFAGSHADSANAAAAIAGTVNRIEAMASPYGGFAFWPGGAEAPGWLTAYATFALGRAERAGSAVSPEVLANARAACARNWRSPWKAERGSESPADSTAAAARAARLEWWFDSPAGLQLLAMSETVRPEPGTLLEPADIDVLVDHATLLADDQQLLLALALERWSLRPEVVQKTLERALAQVEVSAAGAVVPAAETGRLPAELRTSARTTSLALWLAARTRPGDPLVPRLAAGLLGMRAGGHWKTTQDDALALLALAEYRDRVERTAGSLDAAARLTGMTAPLVTLAAPAGSLERRTASVALPLDAAGSAGGKSPAGSLALDFATRGPVHYTAIVRWEEDARVQPVDEGGFTLMRQVQRFEGDGPMRLGDLAVVTLAIVVPRGSSYLAIVDPLPGGLEIVQNAFRVESRRVTAELARWPQAHPEFPVSYASRGDRELRLFADAVPAGVYQYRYVARVRAAGGFAQLPARIEAMYAPDLHGATVATRWRALGPAREATK